MKRGLILFSLLVCWIITVRPDFTRAQRDSIFKRIEAMPADSTRLKQLELLQDMNMRSVYARDFIDRFLQEAKAQGDKEREILALCGYFRLAYAEMDTEKAKEELERVKQLSYQYASYDNYFKSWKYYLAVCASLGNTEQAINEAKQMKKEALRLNNEGGVVCAQISLATAYRFTKNDAKAEEVLEETLTLKGVTALDSLSVYGDLFGSYYNQKKYEEALHSLQDLKSVIDGLVQAKPASAPRYIDRYLSVEVFYADVYLQQKKYDLMRLHLEQAKKYYRENCFLTYYINYHYFHSAYYAHLKQWDLCFQEMELALKRLGGAMPLQMLDLLAHKAYYLEQAGRLKEAVTLHQKIIAVTDSLNRNFLEKQEETISENYRWECGVLERTENEFFIRMLSIGFISILSFLVLFFVWRFWLIQQKLKRSKAETEIALQAAQESEQLKASFLHHFKSEVYSLMEDTIGGLGRLIDTRHSTPESRCSELSFVQNNTMQMSLLIDKVLELSLLETKKRVFKVEVCNILSICYEVLGIVEGYKKPFLDLHFSSKVEVQMIEIDKGLLLDCITSIINPQEELVKTCKVQLELSYSEDGQQVILECVGSPLATGEYEQRQQQIQNKINGLFVESFKGTYQVNKSDLHPKITLTLPCYD